MNRRFRLGALERLRAGKLADATGVLAAARRELAAALGHRDRIKGELRRTAAAWSATPSDQQTAATRRTRLREDLVRAGERIRAAESQELAAVAAWNAARSDLRAVEALHERHRVALADADARTEQRELDEYAALCRRLDVDGDPE